MLNADQPDIHWGENLALTMPARNDTEDDDSGRRLHDIFIRRRLSALFQPVVTLAGADVYGYEGLIRGPADSPLHAPPALFEAARAHDLVVEIEHLCRQVVLEAYARHALPCKLFLNVSPQCLVRHNSRSGATLRYIDKLGLDARNVIIELTESSPAFDYELLLEAVRHYRGMGFQIAMDDLGEGFSSLRLWSELRPDYVKIDKHFIHGIDQDAVKLQFVRSIQQIAENAGCRVIAEGIETAAELAIVRDLHINYGQGFFFGRPQPEPGRELEAAAVRALHSRRVGVFPTATAPAQQQATVTKLLSYVEPVTPRTSNDAVFSLFEADASLYSLPVVHDGVPVGLISRYSMIDGFARPFRRELYGRRSCECFMDTRPLIVTHCMSLHALSDLITDMEPHHLSNGFIITTDDGRYLGLGSGHALLREITQMQLHAARYANPLTLLPGNVPINEHIDRLLKRGARFWTCYADLDNFKPYNDHYGFRKGDELIQFASRLLSEATHPERDFVGHIGGDDFMLLFQSEDWEGRCQAVLKRFAAGVADFYHAADWARRGIEAEDRKGRKTWYGLISLSIGVVLVEPGAFGSHHEVAAAATVAKKQAKEMPGNAIFLERRQYQSGTERHTPEGGCALAP